MNTSTTAAPSARPLGFGSAIAIQLRLLWQSRRPLFLLIGLLAVLTLAGPPWNDDVLVARFVRAWPLWLALIGPIWAFAVWSGEGPSDRFYYWSQPVGRAKHTLARLVAGGLWLLAAYAALVLLGLLYGALDGNAAQLGQISLAGWVNFFTAPLLGFLGVSILTVLTDRPIWWFLGLVVGMGLLFTLIGEWMGERVVEMLLIPLGARGTEWGLGPTLVVPLAIDAEQIIAATRQTNPSSSDFPMAVWWTALPLWLLFFAGLVGFAATLHPDRLPRLRRRR